MYEAQDNVPLPEIVGRGPKSRRKYPFETMAPGDMFFVPEKTTNSIGAHVSAVAKKLGRRFASRQTIMRKTKAGWAPCHPSETGATRGVGVWRTK